ncbi:MAG: exosortase/archaeosortase family protein [Gammaproteobacteria bacterium]|nr:exosortase/archaeosortase family protein [Gammaproteobacteria bacterium]
MEYTAPRSFVSAPHITFVVLIGAIFAPSLFELARYWWVNASEFVGVLAPAIAIGYAYVHRDEIAAIPASPSALGLPLLATGVALQLVALSQQLLVLTGVAIVLCGFGAVWLFYGARRARALWFSIVFLFFAFPVFETLDIYASFTMRVGSAALAEWMVTPFTEVTRNGTQLLTKNLELSVVAACSGMNYMATLMMLAVGIAAVAATRPIGRAVLLACAPGIVLLANGLRIAVVAMLGEFYGRDVAIGFFHEFSGLITFAVAVLGLAVLGYATTRWFPAKKGTNA